MRGNIKLDSVAMAVIQPKAIISYFWFCGLRKLGDVPATKGTAKCNKIGG